MKRVADPARVTIRAGVRVGEPRQAVASSNGEVRAFRAGSDTAPATAMGATGPITLDIPVIVSWPALSKLTISADSGRLYTGAMLGHRVAGTHPDGSVRTGLTPTWRTSNPAVASVDRLGNVTALRADTTTIAAESEGVTASKAYTVVTNPVATIALDITEDVILTGQVVLLNATARTASGAPVKDAVITWSYTYAPDDATVAPGGPGIVD